MPERCPECGGRVYYETENGLNLDVCSECDWVGDDEDEWRY